MTEAATEALRRLAAGRSTLTGWTVQQRSELPSRRYLRTHWDTDLLDKDPHDTIIERRDVSRSVSGCSSRASSGSASAATGASTSASRQSARRGLQPVRRPEGA